MDFLNNVFYGNTVKDWIIAGSVLLGVSLFLYLFKRILKWRLLSRIEHSQTELDDFLIPLLRRTKVFFIIALGIFIGSQFLTLAETVQGWIDQGMRVIFFLQVGFWGMGLIVFYVERQVSDKVKEDEKSDATTIGALGLVAKIALWVLMSVIILDNLGVEVTSLITTLGIGGIAVALAVQNVLGDLFSSLSIALDKPFVIDDFIVVDDFAGTVERVGLKSTRLQSLSGEELIFSNSDLLNSRIRNYKRLKERRIAFSLGVTYGTPPEDLVRIPNMIEEIISPMEDVRFERAHFKEMGDFSLNYEIVYYALRPEYNFYMDVQENINLAIYERFTEEGIDLAFPTQTLILEKEDKGPAS